MKAVKLRFGQRIGAFLLDGILRGQHKERLFEVVGLSGGRSLRAPAWPAARQPEFWAACG